MVVTPEIPCRFAARGCAERIAVTGMKEHLRQCRFHPAKMCKRLEETSEGQAFFEEFYRDALAPLLENEEMKKLPLTCSEAMDPGFVDSLAAGYAYDIVDDYCNYDLWEDFRRKTRDAQKAFHEDQVRKRQRRDVDSATKLCCSLLGSDVSEETAREAVQTIHTGEATHCLSFKIDLQADGWSCPTQPQKPPALNPNTLNTCNPTPPYMSPLNSPQP